MEKVNPSQDRGAQQAVHRVATPWLEWGDRLMHMGVGILFLAAAVAMGVYSLITFIQHLGNDFPLAIIAFINDLLLVLIILEVLGTVRSYLASGDTSLKPFLYIGIISATRRILAIGAQSTFGEKASDNAFNHLMIDLGVNGAVVLALALALYLFGREVQEVDETTVHGSEQ